MSLDDIFLIKQVGLIGHDWGGFIGFLMCLLEPKRFSAFLALDIGHPFQRAWVGCAKRAKETSRNVATADLADDGTADEYPRHRQEARAAAS